jgi:hypothetical protein
MAEKKNFVLRLSPEMYAELEKWASQEFRSVNGQIEFVLHQAIQHRKKNSSLSEKGDGEKENKAL